jgi:enamine deaminase RidA (YjgF/YER057c/UK114 family)
LNFGFDQTELLEGHHRQLVCSGQTSVDADANPQHPADMAAQLNLALDNLEAVLAGAEMTLANLVRINLYTIDVDTPMQHHDIVVQRLASADAHFATTPVGVTRLAFPELLVEIEATAAD